MKTTGEDIFKALENATLDRSSAASDVYKRQTLKNADRAAAA